MTIASFPNGAEKTDKTYITNISSNNDFMAEIFGTETGEYMPMWATLTGNPNHHNGWPASQWQIGISDLPHAQNNYFTLCTYGRNDNGQYKRQKKNFYACHAFMLDDIGTKIPMERLTLPPSWMIETSEGNFQAGYILESPITDPKLADRILKSIIEAGLCDAGANGITSRMARLPFAINGKRDPVFTCQLREWNPDLRYSVDNLIHKLELDISEKPKKAKAEKKNKPDGFEELFIDCPSENPVIKALQSRGLYKAPLGDGKHDATCPWVHEHTDAADSGTACFEPDDQYPVGGFKCQHGHCTDRHIKELLSFLEIEPATARMKATIRQKAGEVHRISDRAEQQLAKVGRYYQRGGIISAIVSDPSTKDISVKGLSRASVLSALSSVCIWETYKSKSDGYERIDPPEKVVSVVFDNENYRHLNPLNGLCHQPFLREDGSFGLQSGYDPLTGMFGIFDAKRFHIPDSPTRKDAETALAELQNLLSEFCFANKTDHAGAIAAILTASIRQSLPLAPMFHVKAPQIGSGKSYLCELIAAFASPKRGSPTTFPMDDEECRKLLLAEFMRAPAVIEFDNMTTDIIAHKSLCTALTSEFLTDRILGISKTATVSTRALFLSSGNNVQPVADMARRCLTITLDPRMETPATKDYKNKNLVPDVLKNREKFVSYALTIIQAWIVAGKPKADCKPLGSYGVWSDYCRQPLLWLGLSDPTDSIIEAMAEDPDRETLGRLLHAWKFCFGTGHAMIRDAVNKTYETSKVGTELFEVISDIASDGKQINRRVLGRWIKRYSNRIVDGMRFVKASGTRSAEAWKVEVIE